MSNDQTTPQDPTEQHSKPAGQGQEIPHPGITGDMRAAARPRRGQYRGSDRLSGKKAVITGGDSGIGRAVALAFAREGADVLISYLPEEEDDAQETAALVERRRPHGGARCPATSARSSSAAASSTRR